MEVAHCVVCKELIDVEDLDDELVCTECQEEAKNDRQLRFDYYSRLL